MQNQAQVEIMSPQVVNVRGTLNAMAIGAQVNFDSAQVRPSYVRWVASTLKREEGKVFSVSNTFGDAAVKVTRTI